MINRIILFAFILFPASLYCQSEKFDITNFTPPKGWQKETKQDYISYITYNQTTGGFCLIVLYGAVPGSNNAEQEFKKEWNDLVVKVYGAGQNPKTETQINPDGWKVTAGAAAVQKDNISSYLILSVFSGFDKTISVLANLNDQAYIAEIDKFLVNMKPDKNSTLTINTTPNNQVISNNNNSNSPGKFGLLSYNAPAGWKTTIFQNGVALSPVDLPAEEFLEIRIIHPLNFSGSPEQALAKSYDEVCSMLQVTQMNDVNGKNYSVKETKRSFKGWEYIRCSGGIQVNNGTPYPAEYGLDLFIIKINDRYERIAAVKSRNACGGLTRYYTSDRAKYTDAIENFLFSLKFDDWKEPVVKPGTTLSSGIVGAWHGLSMSAGLAKAGAVLGAELVTKQLILFSNGQGYFGKYFPAEGLEGFNTWIAAENNRRDWGFYSFSNGRGVLKMPYGDIPLRLDHDKLIITTNKTDHGFLRLPGVDGARFNGTYIMSEAYGTIPIISFTSDGKFVDKGAIRVLSHESTDCLNEALNQGSGEYEVKNHSMMFYYSDGRKLKIAVTGSEFNRNNLSPPVLVLSYNEDILRKQ
jgi:hypothetical protein